MKRQKVTLTRRFWELVTKLNNQDRLTAYDMMLCHLFNGESLQIEDESDAVQVVISFLAPELRKAQAQYENGIISKKLSTNSQGLLCPFDGSQPQANIKPEKSPNDYNIYNNKNIFLPINQSNHQGGKMENCTFDAITDGNVNMYAHALEQIIKHLQPINAMVSLRTAETLSKIIKSKTIKIKGEEHEPASVLKQIYENIRQVAPSELVKVLEELYNDIDSRKVTNKTKYEIMSLFKIYTRIKKQSSKPTQNKSCRKRESWEREYNPENFKEIFDDLDSVEI